MIFKHLRGVNSGLAGFAGFKRFEPSDVKKVDNGFAVYFPAIVDVDKTFSVLKEKKLKLVSLVDESKTPFIAILREVTARKPLFNSQTPVLIIDSGVDKTPHAVLGRLYSSRIESSDKRMALELARAIQFKEVKEV